MLFKYDVNGMLALVPRPGITDVLGDENDIDLFDNRAGVSRFYFRCFQNATGSSSGPSKVPELRIELEATIFHAGGPEIG